MSPASLKSLHFMIKFWSVEQHDVDVISSVWFVTESKPSFRNKVSV